MSKLMKLVHRLFPVAHFAISALFMAAGFALLVLAMTELWAGIQLFEEASMGSRISAVLQSIAILTVALASLELGQTILEEEVQRDAHMSAPTRVRRFLSRFMVVLVVALSIETLVLIFHFGREAPEMLPYVATVGYAAAALLAAWALFVWLNRGAEQLEPEAMQEAKREDRKVEESLKGEDEK